MSDVEWDKIPSIDETLKRYYNNVEIYEYFYTMTFSRYRYHETNPYRRYCGVCNQQQDQFNTAGHELHTWWSAMGSILNAACICHRDAK